VPRLEVAAKARRKKQMASSNMGLVKKAQTASETAKWIFVTYLLSLLAGGLAHGTTRGRLDDANRAAMFIVLVTMLAFIIALCAVGFRRWKKGMLDASDKPFVVFSLVMYPVLFAMGWLLNIL
jgi:cytochrome bd-type quinol oxidase subunit 2